MNKRQKKKRGKIIKERFEFFNKYLIYGGIYAGRRSGKTYVQNKMMEVILSKKHKPFKELKKKYESFITAIDYSNGKDYSVETTAKINRGKLKILKVEVIE